MSYQGQQKFPVYNYGPQGVGQTETTKTVFQLLPVAGSAASAYHGYRRNNSVGWAVAWGMLGFIFPIITPAIAFAQGFGERKKS